MGTMSDPHWLVQELAGQAMWTAVGVGAAYAWNRREAIKRALWRQPTIKHSAAYMRGTSSATAKGTVVQLAGVPSDELTGTLTVSSERTALWNIEAPTRQRLQRLGDELLELGSWYLHQS
jgi:hypothetical protein